MNKSYKVVFSKARGVLMVVNECTKSVQAKGTKTVVAAAVTAMISSVSIAAVPDAPTGDDVYTNQTGNASWDEVAGHKNIVYQYDGHSTSGVSLLTSKEQEKKFEADQTLWVIGHQGTEDAEPQYTSVTGLWASGAGHSVVNDGTIYAKGVASKYWKTHAMGADSGAKAVNNGLIEVENAYGMNVGTAIPGATIENGEKGRITVYQAGVGMELGGAAGSQATNSGTITAVDEKSIGIQIKGQANGTFTNNGKIEAVNGCAVLAYQNTGDTKIILTKTSQVNGRIFVANNSATTLELKGTTDTLKLQADKTANMSVILSDAADVALEDGFKNYFTKVDIDNGRLTASVGKENNTFEAVEVGKNGVFAIDVSSLESDEAAVAGTLTVEAGGEVVLNNLTSVGTFTLAETVDGLEEVQTGNAFLDASLKGGVVTTKAKQTSGDAELDGAFARIVNGYGDQANRDVLAAIGAEGSVFVDENGNLTDRGVEAAAEYLAVPVTAGVYNVAYDAAEQVNGAIMKRNVKGEGMGVWADVFYASNEAKNIYGGQGYSADIYGGVLGFDTTFSCGAKLGAAVTVGTGDADSEKSVWKFSNDADFYGVSIYTGKNVGDTSLYIGADMSYLWIENDLKGTVEGVSEDESLDSTAFTIGLRADWTAYEGAFSVVPHAGIRYTALDVDDYHGIESHSMNVLELPVGVKVAGAFEPAAGWTLVPSVDFTITPQVGDKSVDTILGEVDVIDNLYNTTVGVEAVNGSFSFGLTGGYGFGNDDRQNASVKANVRYAF